MSRSECSILEVMSPLTLETNHGLIVEKMTVEKYKEYMNKTMGQHKVLLKYSKRKRILNLKLITRGVRVEFGP